jgi:hypothetical protein
MTGPVCTRAAPQPWWIRLVADPDCSRPKTALAVALLHAVEKALFDPRSELHAQTFGFYLDAADQARQARIAANSFAPPSRRKRST